MSENSQSETWRIRDILDWTAARFRTAGFSTPLLDAQLLLSHALSADKVKLYMELERPLTLHEREVARALVKRRLSGEPVAYIIGKKNWHQFTLEVDKRVLIPRPETETLLDFVLGWLRSCRIQPRTVFDLCTGSGCLAIALAHEYSSARVVGVDICEEALQVAQKNAAHCEVSSVSFVSRDLLLQESLRQLITDFGFPEVIVANPPYLSSKEWRECAAEVRDFEPKKALIGGESGTEFALQLLRSMLALDVMEHCLCFCMELGIGQASLLAESLSESGFMHLNMSSMLQFSAANDPWQFPEGQFFSLKDIDGRERFLCFLRRPKD